ncbi:hypothetical protein [Actinoplanes sp. NBRC 103695]|uniref:hypothetical protein n=1 Tax=Actinoplanes sp. NBRC 103695 TaxID=3032202 RepID=UPI00249FA51F|nr:hypothetical protein [Actinoplanes sp. NBRC 103695]GLY96633.1 hypothetical protein Acsp02_38880 [Actinoplanes sp. NBRC 103695]
MSVATVLAGGLIAGVLATPGGWSPERESDTSVFGPQQVKTATATCTSGTRYAGGGVINYGMPGAGGVAITGILPDEEGDSVTVTARAPAGRVGNWSVTAYVMCQDSALPEREIETGAGIAEAECSDTTALFGLGFHVEGGVVKEVTMDAALHRVRVVAGDWGTQVTAIALCRPAASEMRRAQATTTSESWPIVASGSPADPDVDVYPVGAAVTGPPSATLDALVPGPLTWARGTLLGGSGQRAFADEGGSVTVEAGLIGTFH